MHRDCIDEIQNAIGRALSEQEKGAIEATITEEMRNLARADPKAYAAMSLPERMQAAAERAQQQNLAEAARQRRNASLAVVAAQRLVSQVHDGAKAGKVTGARSLANVLNRIDVYGKGVAREYFSNMVKAMELVEPRFFGLIENAKNAAAFVKEVYNNASGISGDKNMKAAARVWLDNAGGMLERFNRSGGDTGKLDYGYLPQNRDIARVRTVMPEEFVAKELPRLNRSMYVDPVTAKPMSDAQVSDILRSAYNTITTDGTNTIIPGQPSGYGARANKRSEHRVIHYTEEGYLASMNEFGSGSVFSGMQKHISGLSRDIALLEEMGPNPEQMFKMLDDTALKIDRGTRHFGFTGVTNEQLWSTLSGKANQVAHQRFADVMQGMRSIEVFGKLGSALLSSINDLGTLYQTARYNKLPVLEAFTNMIRAYGPEMKDYANRSGLAADSIIGDMSRWAESNLRDNTLARLANATMKVSFLEAWTDAIRRGFSVQMQGALGKISRTDWEHLAPDDRGRLAAKGVTPEDFAIWKLAKSENWRGSDMLTPESVRAISDADLQRAGLIPTGMVNPADAARLKDRAVSRMLGLIIDESEYASIAPDLHTKTLISFGGQQRGTLGGEIGRSVGLFKGFPIAMMTRHLGRILNDDMTPWSRVRYAASLATMTTAFGALAIELKDIKEGKDPRDMTSPKFWAASVAQGAAAGFLGDLIYQATGGMQSQGGVSTAANTVSAVAGPVAGSVAEFADLTLGNLGQAMKGKDTHAGAEAVRFARMHTPFVNLWYAKAAIDHAVLNDVQELLSPGYLARMQQRVKRDWGNEFYWKPQEALPQRGPDLTAAGGK